jgi:pilus assembly protein Flp/PilA
MLKLYTWYKTKMADLRERLKDEEGQDIIEYALIIVLIVLIALATSPGIGTAIQSVFSAVIDSLQIQGAGS